MEEEVKTMMDTVGEATDEQDILDLKKAIIKKALQNEDLDLDNQSSEQLDDLMVKTLRKEESLDKQVSIFFEAMIALNTSLKDCATLLEKSLEIKPSEAKDIYLENINSADVSKINRIYEALNAEEKEEILDNNEPEAVEPVSTATDVSEIKDSDPIKSLEDQKGDSI